MPPSDKYSGWYLSYGYKHTELYRIAGLLRIYSVSSPFHQDILHSSISAMCYVYHRSYGKCDTYKLTSGVFKFPFYSGYKVAGKAISAHE